MYNKKFSFLFINIFRKLIKVFFSNTLPPLIKVKTIIGKIVLQTNTKTNSFANSEPLFLINCVWFIKILDIIKYIININ